MKTIRIVVVGGVAYVGSVPPGVTVEVTDYDVDQELAETRDEAGVPCARYSVSGIPARANRAAVAGDPRSEPFNDQAERTRWVTCAKCTSKRANSRRHGEEVPSGRVRSFR